MQQGGTECSPGDNYTHLNYKSIGMKQKNETEIILRSFFTESHMGHNKKIDILKNYHRNSEVIEQNVKSMAKDNAHKYWLMMLAFKCK